MRLFPHSQDRGRRPEHLSGSSGFALIETVIAFTIFAIISVAVTGLLAAGINSQGLSRQRTLAEQIVSDQVEQIRQMAGTLSGYKNVGTTNGNPQGSLAPSTPVTIQGLAYTKTIQVTWVNDKAPTAYTTLADYKKVTVSVVRTSDSAVLSKQVTYVGPSSTSSYGGQTLGVIEVQVIDQGNLQPVPNVQVNLANGPTGPLSDRTDGSGTVYFPALTPNPSSGGTAYYDLSVTPPSGYTALSTDVSPAAVAHVKVTAGSTTGPQILHIYLPATVNLGLLNPDGSAFNGTATVTLAYTLAGTNHSDPYTVTGTGVVNNVVPGIQYTATASATSATPAQTKTSAAVAKTVPQTYPTDLTSSYALTIPWMDQRATLNVLAGGAPYDGSAGTLNVTFNGTTYPMTTGTQVVTLPGAAPKSYTAVAKGISGSVATTVATVTQAVPNAYPTDLTSTFTLNVPLLKVNVQKKTGSPLTCTNQNGLTVTVTGGPNSVTNAQDTTDSSGNAYFVLPPGTTNYTISTTSGSTITLSNQTINAAPALTTVNLHFAGC